LKVNLQEVWRMLARLPLQSTRMGRDDSNGGTLQSGLGYVT
jgi:hypothetical protein